MTMQEFQARGQDYADLREALRDIEILEAEKAELLAACEAVVNDPLLPSMMTQIAYDSIVVRLRTASARARGEVAP